MRLKYYKRTIRQMRLNKAFVFTLIVIVISVLIIIYMYSRVAPIITTLSESSAKSIALRITNDAVSDNIGNIAYENLVTLNKDQNGNVVSLSVNAIQLNRLSTNISSSISEKLNEEKERYIKLPLTSLFGASFLSGYGPKIPLSVIPSGNVSAKFNSEFEEARNKPD